MKARSKRGEVLTFQSPSRWGRCCISVSRRSEHRRNSRFSPLLDGDGVASSDRSAWRSGPARVSVPFSMGTVLHRQDQERHQRDDPGVSVPFSMGTVLHLVDRSKAFSMGTVLHLLRPQEAGQRR